MFFVFSKKVLKLTVNELWRGRKDKKGQGRVRKGKGGEERMVRKGKEGRIMKREEEEEGRGGS